jgi:sugar/nucleoside kinase (ribokinase family)
MPSDDDQPARVARVLGERSPVPAAVAQSAPAALEAPEAQDAAIIGNVNVDILLWPAAAVPPPGQEWVIEAAHVRPGGAAANAALTMAGLGAHPRLIGCVGEDGLGRDLLASLPRAGTGHEVAVIGGTQTGVSVAFQAPGRDRSFLIALGSLARFGVADIPADAAASGRLLLCGYFTLPMLRGWPTADLLARARAAGTTTFLDTGWDPLGWPPDVRAEVTALLPMVDVFLPNAQEARALTGIEDPGLAARAIRGSSGGGVIVKLGAAGCLALGSDGRELRVPAPAVTVTDATGAGDALNGALLSALAAGAAWEDAVSFAVRAASAVVARPSHARYPRMADVPPN